MNIGSLVPLYLRTAGFHAPVTCTQFYSMFFTHPVIPSSLHTVVPSSLVYFYPDLSLFHILSFCPCWLFPFKWIYVHILISFSLLSVLGEFELCCLFVVVVQWLVFLCNLFYTF